MTDDHRPPADIEMRVEPPSTRLDAAVEEALREGLERCPDVAFAHLPQVLVAGRQEKPNLVLFVWLRPEALRSLRSALNTVSEVAARALPADEFVDVVILNSMPEALAEVEAAGCLVAEPDPAERSRALAAAAGGASPAADSTRRWWWPF